MGQQPSTGGDPPPKRSPRPAAAGLPDTWIERITRDREALEAELLGVPTSAPGYPDPMPSAERIPRR